MTDRPNLRDRARLTPEQVAEWLSAVAHMEIWPHQAQEIAESHEALRAELHALEAELSDAEKDCADMAVKLSVAVKKREQERTEAAAREAALQEWIDEEPQHDGWRDPPKVTDRARELLALAKDGEKWRAWGGSLPENSLDNLRRHLDECGSCYLCEPFDKLTQDPEPSE